MYKGILSLICAILITQTLVAGPKREIRAAWLTTNYGLDWPSRPVRNEADRIRQQKELCSLLDMAQQMNLNVILFQVRLRGDVIYPSALEPWNSILTGKAGQSPGYDPLAYAVQACHERGLQCHAWLVCMPLGSERQVKSHGNASVVAKHPNWCKKMDGEWYFDPGHPEVAGYLASLAGEITRNYDIDGIHLDYIRYPDKAGRFADNDTFRKYGKPGQNLEQYRRENINRTVYTIYDEVKRSKPWVKVSSSPLGKYNKLRHYSAYGWSGMERVHQDAQEWIRQGKQDFIAPMMYYNNEHFYPFLYNWIQNSRDRFVVSGLGAYRMEPAEGNWSADELLKQITWGRNFGVSGQAYYRLGNLKNDPRMFCSKLMAEFYTDPALFPALTYLDSIAPLPPTLSIQDNGKGAELCWLPVADAKEYVVYASPHTPVDINDAGNIVKAGIRTTHFRIVNPRPLYYAVTALDAFHNESEPDEIYSGETVHIPDWNDFRKLDNPRHPFVQVTICDLYGHKIYDLKGPCPIKQPILDKGIYRATGYKENEQCNKMLVIQ